MSVEDTLQNALDFLERQDLRATLLKRFPQILRTVHSYEKFTHDLKVYQVVDPVLVDSKLYVFPTDTPLLRDLVDVKTYTAHHTSMINGVPVVVGDNLVAQTYRDLSQGNDKTDYFGFKYEQGFYKVGNNITIVGISEDIKLVDMLCSIWPTWEYDSFTDTYSSNSWILEKYPQLIEQHLIAAGAANQQMTAMLNIARQELGGIANEFINEFAGDIYGR
jgi:hypothetical protein